MGGIYGTIDALYKPCGCMEPTADDSLVKLDSDAVDRILGRIASKDFDPKNDIEQELFEQTFDALNRAVDAGFGKVSYGDNDFDFVNELKYNNAVFAAFKTHREQNDLHRQLFNPDGSVRSFAEFRRSSMPIIGAYNGNWLQTEYSTGVLRAHNAAKWKEMERDTDLYPNMEWLPSTSVSPREEHRALYGKVFAMDDPFLQTNYPGCLWNCKCGLRSTSKPVTERAARRKAARSTPKPAAGLDRNPGQSGMLYSFSHPYFAAGYFAYKKLAPIVSKWVNRYLADKPPLFPIYRKIEKNVFVSPWQKGAELAGNIRMAKSLAQEGHKVYLLPELYPDVPIQKAARRLVLPKGVKPGKNPDAYVDGEIFEFKTLENKVKRSTVQGKIRTASTQADNILIECHGAMSLDEIKYAVKGQAKMHEGVKQVWVLYNGDLHKFIREPATP